MQTDAIPFIQGTGSVDISFSHLVKVSTVTQQFLDYLTDQSLVIEVWRTNKVKNQGEKLPTRQPPAGENTAKESNTSVAADKETTEESNDGVNPMLAFLFAPKTTDNISSTSTSTASDSSTTPTNTKTNPLIRIQSTISTSGGSRDKASKLQ